jgi:ribosomal protein S27E
MVPLSLAGIEDLGPGDFMQVDCAACSHTALLSTAFLIRLGLSPRDKVLDLKDRVRCRSCGLHGQAIVSIKRAKSAQ